MNAKAISKIKVGDSIRCIPTHNRASNSTRWRKVTAVEKQMKYDDFAGVAVKAHGYDTFWLKNKEILEHKPKEQ